FSQIDSSFAYYHERHLTSLIPFTAYFYKIVCWDTTGVRGFTKINEFQTSGDSSVFSVNLISFSLIRLEYDKIRLIWKTEFEREMYGFEIQRSEDNTHFKKIGFIKASGSGKAIHLYQFTDSKVKQYPAFYRLKLISDNGPDDYSEIIKISSVFPQKFTLGVNYPNPFTDKTKLTFFVPKKFLKQNAKVVIFNVNGQAVFEKKLTNLNSENEFVWNGDDNNYRRLPSGIYFLLLKLNGKKLSRKIVLVR
ncbi:MAG TPA: T9SS type A sorting domain-containing protein, partial [Candidatus Marinimicrobia bacterium]|nr:T9SS type A sorting domain-containing protein [Candidatus Neomarinimicrobiota bacterium]